MAERTLYEIMMIDPNADMGIITVVYHALAKRHHPDRTNSLDDGSRMSEINAAYEVLSEVASRQRYDHSIGLSSGWSGAPERVAIAIETDGAPATNRVDPAAEPTSAYGEAGPPPPYPLPSGSVLTFGRYQGWAISQVDGYDRSYLEWLRRTPTGRMYQTEIEAFARRHVSA